MSGSDPTVEGSRPRPLEGRNLKVGEEEEEEEGG